MMTKLVALRDLRISARDVDNRQISFPTCLLRLSEGYEGLPLGLRHSSEGHAAAGWKTPMVSVERSREWGRHADRS
jgi:hypothetical protein